MHSMQRELGCVENALNLSFRFTLATSQIMFHITRRYLHNNKPSTSPSQSSEIAFELTLSIFYVYRSQLEKLAQLPHRNGRNRTAERLRLAFPVWLFDFEDQSLRTSHREWTDSTSHLLDQTVWLDNNTCIRINAAKYFCNFSVRHNS